MTIFGQPCITAHDYWREDGSMQNRVTMRGGWSVTVRQDHQSLAFYGSPYRMPVSGAVTTTLDGLVVTQDQAAAIMARRSSGQARYGYDYLYNRGVRMDGIELTPDEASTILGGADPLSVLLPALYVRALTMVELMGE